MSCRFTAPQRAAFGTAALFLVNGVVVGTWVPLIPERARQLHLDPARLGNTLLAGGLGCVLAMPWAAWLTGKLGSRTASALMGSGFALALALSAAVPSRALLMASLLLFGMCGASMDIAMNAQAVLVEGRLGRPVLSRMHGVYSAGNVVGSLVCSAALHRGAGSRGIAQTAALALVLLVLTAQSVLLPQTAGAASERRGLQLDGRLIAVGALVFSAMIVEGAVADWAALFLKAARGFGPGAAGLGFAGFAGTMLLGRMTGDRVVARLGESRALRWGGLAGVAGLLAVLLVPGHAAAVAGFALLGLGVANASPVLYRAAGRLPGVPAGVGLATAVGIGYAGLLLGPPLLGHAGQAFGLPSIFAILAVLCATLAAAAGLARQAP